MSTSAPTSTSSKTGTAATTGGAATTADTTPDARPLLELRKVGASYGPVPALQAIDLVVPDGGVVALLGANGAGKTTLLRAVCNMMVRTTGEIRLAGQRIDGRSTETIARLGIAHVPEGRGTFLELSVEENLRLGAYLRRDRAAVARDEKRVLGYFPVLGERRRQQAGTLSGGEQQMLAIARALMLHPRLLLLDEPSFGLAPLVVKKIFSILEAISRQDGIGMLLVEQNAGLALELATHAFVLEAGRMALSGSASAIAGDELVRRAYLGL
ncbi:MAG TPA: ABC transporter ATP-binding protein [Kofleriaceae bacterium]|nr:ABC transporter ATP-binding protein [Kofleriaceae bacterium]